MTAQADYPRFVLDGPLGRALVLPAPDGTGTAPAGGGWIEAAAWEGEGPLDGVAVRFSRKLNVIAGGRGVGKSTLLASLAEAAQAGSLSEPPRRPLFPMTCQLLVRDEHGDLYCVEKAARRAPTVRDQTGAVIDRPPGELLKGALFVGEEAGSVASRSSVLLALVDGARAEEPRREQELKRLLQRNQAALAHLRQRQVEAERDLARVVERSQAAHEPLRKQGLTELGQTWDALLHDEEEARLSHKLLQEALGDLLRLDQAIEEAMRSSPRATAALPAPAEGQEPFAAAAAALQRAARRFHDELSRQGQPLEAKLGELSRSLSDIQASAGADLHVLNGRREAEHREAEARRAISALERDAQLLDGEREQLASEREELLVSWMRRLEAGVAQINSRAAGRLRIVLSAASDGLPEARLELGLEDSAAPLGWHPVEHLSGGGRARAALLLALAVGEGPILMDSMDSMVDSHVVADAFAPALLGRKADRQLIVVAGGPLLPTVAQAEQVIGLAWEITAKGGKARLAETGPVAAPSVRAFFERTFGGAGAIL